MIVRPDRTAAAQKTKVKIKVISDYQWSIYYNPPNVKCNLVEIRCIRYSLRTDVIYPLCARPALMLIWTDIRVI